MELEEAIGGARALGLNELLRQRLQRLVPVAAPGAGVEVTQAVPAGVAWEVLSVIAILTTSAVVATRRPILLFRDPDGNQIVRNDAATTQAASLVGRYVWQSGLGLTTVGSSIIQGLPSPPALLPSGWSLATLTAALDAGDAYSSVFIVVREWSGVAVLTAADWLEGHTR